MPREKLNWDTSAVFLDNRYHTKEVWQNREGKDLHPQQAYFVGGQTKVYGAAMFRMRAEDFGLIQHKGGISPAWPISYADVEPYYTLAEELFQVHGGLGAAPSVPGGFGSSLDPTEPFHSKNYPYPALPNEPRMQTIEDDVRRLGINTFPMPLALKRNDADPLPSKCIRCDTCDAYPCLIHAKSDADVICIRQIMHLPNVTLMTNSRVTRLLTNSTGTAITSVEVSHSGVGGDAPQIPSSARPVTYSAGLFALCAGAVNSAVVLLASANGKHPDGLANRSGQVQPIGSFHHEMMKSDAPFFTPEIVLEGLKNYAMPWWLTTEDLPDPENRMTLHNTKPLSVENVQPGVFGPHPSGDTGPVNQSGSVTDAAPVRIQLSYTPNNVESSSA